MEGKLAQIAKDRKLAIFDFDGTLVDSLATWQKIDERFFGRRNIPYDKDGYTHAIMGMNLKEIAAYTISHYGLVGESPDSVVAEWNRNYDQFFKTEVQFFPGTEELLRRLRAAGLKIAIATAATRDIVASFFESRPAAAALIDFVCTVDEVGKAKPDPAVYLRCAQHFGLRPQDCVVFEDELPNLVGASRGRIGCVCYLSSRKHEAEKRAAADFVVEDYRELL